MFPNCSILWKLRSQLLTSLSATRGWYIGLSTALRNVIQIINLFWNFCKRNFPVYADTLVIKCQVFATNQSCIQVVTNHKNWPRTKYLSVKLHHFQSFMVDMMIIVQHTRSAFEISDILRKLLEKFQCIIPRDKFIGLVKWVCLLQRSVKIWRQQRNKILCNSTMTRIVFSHSLIHTSTPKFMCSYSRWFVQAMKNLVITSKPSCIQP